MSTRGGTGQTGAAGGGGRERAPREVTYANGSSKAPAHVRETELRNRLDGFDARMQTINTRIGRVENQLDHMVSVRQTDRARIEQALAMRDRLEAQRHQVEEQQRQAQSQLDAVRHEVRVARSAGAAAAQQRPAATARQTQSTWMRGYTTTELRSAIKAYQRGERANARDYAKLQREMARVLKGRGSRSGESVSRNMAEIEQNRADIARLIQEAQDELARRQRS